MTDIHSCSYFCTRPACVLAQRDTLRNTLMKQAEPVDKLLTKDEPPVDKEQAEPLQGGLTEREICAWKMGYDAAKAEQAEPVVDERNIN